MEDVFANIRAECARKRWSLEELSEKLGIERKTFYNWEAKQDFPVTALVKMASLFGVSTDALLGISAS